MQEKISISVNKELLHKVDGLIDSVIVKNRSQAFEKVMREHFLKEGPGKAVVLLAKAQRIDAVLLRRYMQLALDLHIPEVTIAAGLKNAEAFNLVGSKYKTLKISYLKEDKLLGTAGVLKALEHELAGSFLVISGDVRFDFDIQNMIQFHRDKHAVATMCLTSVELAKSTDNITIEGDKITLFEYKAKAKSRIINAAIYLFEPGIFQYLPRVGSLERDVFPALATKRLLTGYLSNGSEWNHEG